MSDSEPFILNKDGAIKTDIVISANGDLFLAQGNHNVLDYITGRRTIAESSFAAFEANICARNARCHEAGAQYLHAVFPDKQSVLQEEFPVLT